MGNFFVDLVRVTTRVLLPFSIVGGLLLVWQGVPQNLTGNLVVDTIEGAKQAIAMGPVAALEIIKHLGTNGGGFIGANSTTPIENPTIISNLIELYSMMLLPGACVITFGKMVRDRKRPWRRGSSEGQRLIRKEPDRPNLRTEGRSIFPAMGIIFLSVSPLCFWSRARATRHWLMRACPSPWAAWRARRSLWHCPVGHVHHHHHLVHHRCSSITCTIP